MHSGPASTAGTAVRQIDTLSGGVQGDLVGRDRPIDRLWATAPEASASQDTAFWPSRGRSHGTEPLRSSSEAIEAARAKAQRRLGHSEPPASTSVYVAGLQRWDGRIVDVDVNAGMVTSELVPTGDSHATVLADFDVDLLDADADGDVSAGDFIYVTCRRVPGASGLFSTTTSVRLRRLGNWTETDLDDIRDRAERKAQAIASLNE